jgi:hypothetical protein
VAENASKNEWLQTSVYRVANYDFIIYSKLSIQTLVIASSYSGSPWAYLDADIPYQNASSPVKPHKRW